MATGSAGPCSLKRACVFDLGKVLSRSLRPAVVVPKNYSREAAKREGDNAAAAMKSVTIDSRDYDWEGDRPLQRPASRTVIYEMHVRGFTRHPNSGVAENLRGTYRGVIEKIPYLQQLGITAVELLPVFQFDSHDAPPGLKELLGLRAGFVLRPPPGLQLAPRPGRSIEFRDMVKALHRAGIEVILDVVFNHTAEGDHRGPTFSFRGIDNSTYYMLDSDRRATPITAVLETR